ncbi:MAG TPA: cytochrome c, partial [Vicinamibacteria bacterium]
MVNAFVLYVLVASAQSASGGHYTAAQAEKGRVLYEEACASCHGLELSDGAASALAGPGFARDWGPGQNVSDLFGWGSPSVADLYFVIRTTMPQGAAGSLGAEQYVDIVAYILQRNGYASGERPLSAEEATLASIPIEWRAGAEKGMVAPPDFIAGQNGLHPKNDGYLPSRLLTEAEGNA